MAGFAGKTLDPGIVEQARRGDIRAHEIIYRTFSAPVYSLLARMTGSTATADDLSQETFIEVIRSIDRFRRPGRIARRCFVISARIIRPGSRASSVRRR